MVCSPTEPRSTATQRLAILPGDCLPVILRLTMRDVLGYCSVSACREAGAAASDDRALIRSRTASILSRAVRRCPSAPPPPSSLRRLCPSGSRVLRPTFAGKAAAPIDPHDCLLSGGGPLGARGAAADGSGMGWLMNGMFVTGCRPRLSLRSCCSLPAHVGRPGHMRDKPTENESAYAPQLSHHVVPSERKRMWPAPSVPPPTE